MNHAKAYLYTDANSYTDTKTDLSALLAETIDAMPADADPAEYPRIAFVLIGEAVASAVRQGVLPVSERAEMLTQCHAAVYRLPPASSLAEFRAAAREALRNAT